jgi:hypothetical protein
MSKVSYKEVKGAGFHKKSIIKDHEVIDDMLYC